LGYAGAGFDGTAATLSGH